MADRFFHVDVQFGHKRTSQRLLEQFGHAGPLVFLLLLAEAKNGRPPGTFEYESEEGGWSKLGLLGHRPDFTLEEFFEFTGRYKQTRRTCSGRVQNVVLTNYGRWQNESKRHIERTRKARYRAQNKRDTNGTAMGHQADVSRPLDLDLDLSPLPPIGTEEQKPSVEDNLAHLQQLTASIGIEVPT